MKILKDPRTNWRYILIVLVLAFLVGGGILWFEKTQEIPLAEFPELNKPEKPLQAETADWKTYRNEEYGFEVKYPKEDFECGEHHYKGNEKDLIFRLNCKGLVIEDSGGKTIMWSGVGVYENKEMLSFFDWIVEKRFKNTPITLESITLEQLPLTGEEIKITITPPVGYQTITISKIIINNYQGIRVEDVGEGVRSEEIFLLKNDRIYEIGRYDPWVRPIYQKTFDQMLSTFRFLDWQLFSIEEYGFSMKIHPDYTKKEEKEVGRGEIKIKAVIFSRDSEKITMSIDQSENIKMIRSTLLDVFKETDVYQEKGLENFKNLWGIVDPGVEVISLEKVEKGPCVGIQFVEKRGGKYERNLVLTSLNLKDMYLTVSFEYYKDSESGILKMIESIECTK